MRRSRAVRPHPMPCPTLAVLIAYADDSDASISWRRRQRIREHIRRCDACHGHVARGFDEVFHGVHEILKDALDVNQTARRTRDSRFQHALHAQKIELIAPPLDSRWPVERWLALAATLAAIATGLLLLRPAVPVIHAEELIERAIAYERDHAAGSRQRVRQSLHASMFTPTRTASGTSGAAAPRVVPFSTIRTVVDGAVAAGTLPASASQGERDAQLALARLLEKHHFDWRRPFCLACYRAWHASLPHKRDTVTITGDMLALRTTTSDGDLREVTLTFRRDSHRIVRQAFIFEGLGRIEFEEIERHDSTPVRTQATTPQSAPANQHASSVDSRAVVSADAGRLAPIVTSRPPAAGDIERVAPPRLGLSRWLERTFPKSAFEARTTFLPNLERRASSVRQHLIALQRFANLSAAKAGGRATEATEADRIKLRQQIELEYQSMRTHLNALEGHLNLLVGTGTRSMESRAPLPDDWARRAREALPHATRLDYRLQRLFTREDLPPEETRVDRPQSVRATFEALWESIQADLHD
jgi:hypothetical protein